MKLAIVALLTFFATAAFGAEALVLAPNKGYCSRHGEIWVVVKYKGTPEVWLDGTKTPVKITEADAIRHMRIAGVKSGGSELKIKMGDRIETMKVAGSAESGKNPAPFHTNGWTACAGCHAYEKKECKTCHNFKSSKHCDVLNCEDCHKAPGAVPAEASPLCGKCHKDVNIKSHKKTKHPLNAANDPRRPGKVFDCVSCHNPHTPACLDSMKKSELQEWCKNCHARQ